MSHEYYNSTDIEDADEGWKTYYVAIDEMSAPRTFKFGKCKGSVKERFRREKNLDCLEVLEIWNHVDENAAFRHEEKLFRTYPGDRPFIGKMGQLENGGNTEVYSHDVYRGAPAPETFIAKLYSVNDLPVLKRVYKSYDPQNDYAYRSYAIKMHFDGPDEIYGEGDWYQVPLLSTRDRITFATEEFINLVATERRHEGRTFSKRHALDAQQSNILVYSWSKISQLQWSFKAKRRFGIDRYDEWV